MDLEKTLFQAARERGEIPRFAAKVTDLSTKDIKWVLITNTRFSYCRKTDGYILMSYSWFMLTKMNMTEDTLQFDFNNIRVNFESEQIQDIYKTLSDILPRILRPTELISLGYFVSSDDRAPSTPISALMRVTEKAKLRSTKISQQTLKNFTNMILYADEYVDLTHFDNPNEAIPIFFDILPLCPEILGIKVKDDDSYDIYSILSSAVCEDGFLEYIDIDSPVTKHFDGFLRHLSRNKELPISGLSFRNSKMNETNLRSLLKCLSDKYICSVGFHNAILPEHMSTFYNTFLSSMKTKLTVLSLDDTPNIDLSNILLDMPVLEVLSLENCGLDINLALSAFAKKELPSLKGLNLSRNRCIVKSTRALRLPPSLTTLMMHDVEWGDNRLVEFFKSVKYGFKNGFRLDLSKASASIDEWHRLFSDIKKLSIQGFQSLIWDENPVSPLFFSFLKSNPNLDYLSLSGCIGENDVDMMKQFCRCIDSSKLTSLVLRGTPEKSIGQLIKLLVKTLSSSQTIEYVDLSHSKSHDRGIYELKKLLTAETPLRFLSFDECEPRDPRYLFEFLYKAAGNEREIAISFPIKDLTELHSSNMISSDELEWAMNLYRLPQPTMNEKPTPFEEPFEIYIDHGNVIQFPLYLKPTNPSPDGLKTEDMANTNVFSEDRTELTLEMDGDNVNLVPLPKIPQKVIKGRNSLPREPSQDSIELKTMDLQTNEEQHRKRIRRRKQVLPLPPDDFRLTADQTQDGENSASKTNEQEHEKSSHTMETKESSASQEHATQESNQQSTARRRKRKVRKADSSPSTVVSAQSKQMESAPPIAPSIVSSDIAAAQTTTTSASQKRVRTKKRKVTKHKPSQNDPNWAFPIQFNYDETKRKIFITADRENDIDNLIDLIPRF